MLIYLLALGSGLFPSYGFVSPFESFAGALYSGFLPALAIAAPMAASFTRILRTALIETLHHDHVRVARSLGHSGAFIFVHHVFLYLDPICRRSSGCRFATCSAAPVVVERLFGIPGIGALMVVAAFGRDYPLVQACALTFLICVLTVNFAVDLVCTALNPRAA